MVAAAERAAAEEDLTVDAVERDLLEPRLRVPAARERLRELAVELVALGALAGRRAGRRAEQADRLPLALEDNVIDLVGLFEAGQALVEARRQVVPPEGRRRIHMRIRGDDRILCAQVRSSSMANRPRPRWSGSTLTGPTARSMVGPMFSTSY